MKRSFKDDQVLREMAKAFASAIESVAHDAYLATIGAKPLEEAKKKLKGIEINPKLEVAIESILPKGKVTGFEKGTEFLEADKVWSGVVERLTGKTFDKRGMSTYFVQYIQAMYYTQELAKKEAELDLKFSSDDDISGLLIKAGIKSALKKGDLYLTMLFGRLEEIVNDIPADPTGWKERLTVTLWKKLGGATKPDYDLAKLEADKFLAESMTNKKIDILVPDWDKFK